MLDGSPETGHVKTSHWCCSLWLQVCLKKCGIARNRGIQRLPSNWQLGHQIAGSQRQPFNPKGRRICHGVWTYRLQSGLGDPWLCWQFQSWNTMGCSESLTSGHDSSPSPTLLQFNASTSNWRRVVLGEAWWYCAAFTWIQRRFKSKWKNPDRCWSEPRCHCIQVTSQFTPNFIALGVPMTIVTANVDAFAGARAAGSPFQRFSDKLKCLMWIDVGVSTKGLSFVVENHVKTCGSQMGSILAAFEWPASMEILEWEVDGWVLAQPIDLAAIQITSTICGFCGRTCIPRA